MTRPPANDEQFLEYVLRSTRNRIRFVDVASAGLVLLAVAIAMLLGIAVADHAAPGGLSPETRRLLRWVGLAALLAGLGVTVLRPLARRLNDLYIARSIEQANPNFRNELTAALQFDDAADVDPAVLSALKRRAGRRAHEIDITRVVSMRGLGIAAVVCGVAIIVMLVYALLSPKPLLPSVQRALGNDTLTAPTRTRFLAVSPADGSRVISGREVTFTARIEQPVGEAVVRISRDGGKTELDDDVLTMTPLNDDGQTTWHATWTAGAADGLASFRMICGDAATPPRRLHVLPPPVLQDVTTRIEWPAYTRRLPSASPGGDVRALAGSVATVTAVAPLPVTSAKIVFQEAGEVRPIQAAGRNLTARFSVDTAEHYVIHYQLADGLGEARSVAWQVRVLPDEPPEVRLRQPTGELALPVNARLELLAEASDDVGLVDIELHCRRGEETFNIPLNQYQPPGRRVENLRRSFPARRFGQVGDSIDVSVHARDAKPTGPASRGQLGRSAVFTLTILPADRQLAEQQQARQEALDRADAQTQNASAAEAEDDSQAAEAQESAESTTATDRSNPAETAQRSGDSDDDDDTGLEQLLDVTPQEAEQLETLQRHMQPSPEAGETQESSAGESQDGETSSNTPPGQTAEPPTAPAMEDGAPDDSAASGGSETPGDAGQQNGAGRAEEEGNPQNDQGETTGEGQGQENGGGSTDEDAGQNNEGATGMHDEAGGGSEVADEQRGEVEDVDVEALRTRREAQRLESIGRALEEAARQVRDNEVDEQLLEDLGMTPQEFRDFVKANLQKHEQAKRRQVGPSRREEGAVEGVGEDGVQTGRDTALEGVSHEQHGSEAGQDVRESRGRQVAPEYRKYLEGFLTDVNTDPAKPSAD